LPDVPDLDHHVDSLLLLRSIVVSPQWFDDSEIINSEVEMLEESVAKCSTKLQNKAKDDKEAIKVMKVMEQKMICEHEI
jgi:poly-D-alanine transfer protein DltD